MRGCVTAVLLSLFFTTPSFPQCNFSSTVSGQFRSSYLDLALDGSELWAATGYGVQLLDRSTDPPTPVASVAIPGLTRVVRLGSNVAYAASGSRIYAVRRNGRVLTIAGSVDAGATVNDIEVTGSNLYAATAAGLQQYDLTDPASPQRTTSILTTSRQNVLSLAASGTTLYAADGDSTVEQFSIAIPTLPQRTASIDTLTRASSVALTPSRLYISDGASTDVFFVSGSSVSKAATASLATTTFAPAGGEIVFAAGADRRITAIDWFTVASPVELFATDIAPNGGTINRVGSLQVAGNRLYAAGGDAGLLSFDLTSFAAPYPVRSYMTFPTSSTMWTQVDGASRLYATRTSGGIYEMLKSIAGNLTLARQWGEGVHTLRDAGTGTLLSSSGSTLYYWFLGSSTPTLIGSAQLKGAIVSAVLVGTTAYAVIADGSIWSADLAQQTPQAQATSLKGTSLVRSGSAFVVIAIDDEAGTTTMRYFSSADLSQSKSVTFSGGATAAALSGTTAAVVTFRGVSLIDFTSSTIDVIPQSAGAIARSLAFSGTRILELTDTSMLVWDTTTRKLLRTTSLPREANNLTADQLAAAATSNGVLTVSIDGTTTLPALASTQNSNSYYRKAVAAGDRLFLSDGRAISIFTTTGPVPHLTSSIQAQGIVDFAASPASLFTLAQLSSSTTANRYSHEGVLLAQVTLNEGTNVQPAGIVVAGNAVWVSIARDCLTAACEKKTVIFDAQTLARTAILDGAVIDAVTSGARTYALFDLPSEVRVYDTSTPTQPTLLASRTAEGSRAPVSIAASGSTLYVLGEKLYGYDAVSLQKTAEQFDAFQPDDSGATYVDQRVYANGSCLLITGRARDAAQTFTMTPFALASTINVPSVVRSLATAGGSVYVLTDHSIEILRSAPAPALKRRAAR